MAQRGIREYDAKRMLARYLPDYLKNFAYQGEVALAGPETDLEELAAKYPWLMSKRLVVKPDQLFGKRGKSGLILLDAPWEEARSYIKENMGAEAVVGGVVGRLTHFLIEPFIEHHDEYYVAISSDYDGDNIFFSEAGGICVEENWEKVTQIHVDILEGIDKLDIESKLPESARRGQVADFIKALYQFYINGGFAYLEINPFTFSEGGIIPLDLVAKLDDAEEYWRKKMWNGLEFPEPFGRSLTKEEMFIKELDSKTGASLKLTVLNPKGTIWTMVAGGGASVIYADTICDLGYGKELCNYGEYSGDPNTEETYHYTRTILDLMTREPDSKGRDKTLLIGGAIANFTDVAKTFKGVVTALEEYQDRLRNTGVKIYVRRGGPNYELGLKLMHKLGESLGVPIEVFGPETHMTRIVPLALSEGLQ